MNCRVIKIPIRATQVKQRVGQFDMPVDSQYGYPKNLFDINISSNPKKVAFEFFCILKNQILGKRIRLLNFDRTIWLELLSWILKAL
jgi:hypothetical protein